MLIPKKVPPHWKVSYGELEEGKTQISYDPYLFNRNRELEFLVYNRTSGRMTGSFTVDIDRKKSGIRQFLQENLWKLIAFISLITNIFLFIKAGKSKN